MNKINDKMEISQEERQKFLDLVDKVSPCTAISEKENLEKIKEWLDSDRLNRITFAEAPEIFENQISDNKVFLIPIKDKPIKHLLYTVQE